MKITAARTHFNLSNKKLRRARRLYVLFARKGITNTMQLHYAAKRMRRAGLYANPQLNSVRDVAYSILRMMWKLDGGTDRPWPNPNCWFQWAERNGWDIPHRCKVETAA
jgi:hypothetical protein